MKTQTKRLTGLLSGIAILYAPNVFAQLTLEQIQKKDVTARAHTYQELQPQALTNPDDFIAALATGVRDSSGSVRIAASTRAVYVLLALQRAKREKRALPVNITKLDSLKAALSEALIDSEAKVRAAAMVALIQSGAPNHKTEQVLLLGLEKEPNAEIRVGIAKDMALAGYQAPTIETILLDGLDNPDKKIRERAAKAIGIIKPRHGLLKLIKRLDDAEMARDFVVDAVAAYGKEATPYLPELERMRSDKTLGGTLPDRINKAIEAISSAQSQAPTTDQQPKPVDLDRN